MYLYAIYCRKYAKIGITEDPRKRLASLQGASPYPLQLLDAIPLVPTEACHAEREAMILLDDVHWSYDWFRCSRKRALFAIHTASHGKLAMNIPTRQEKENGLRQARRKSFGWSHTSEQQRDIVTSQD